MPLVDCPECGRQISEKAAVCPQCGRVLKDKKPDVKKYRGFEWKSNARLFGWPLVHVAFGRRKETGRLMVAQGVVAIGQFAVGFITIAQFGIGFLFALGQFVCSPIAVAQVALGIIFGLGQVATGITAVGQIAFGKYVLAQWGIGEHLWTPGIRDQEAVNHFRGILDVIKGLLGR